MKQRSQNKQGFLSTVHSRIVRCEQGIAGIELAFVIPLLILLVLGIVSVSSFIRVTQKLETTLSTVANTASQLSPNATASDMRGITNAIPIILIPFQAADATFIITDIKTGPGPTVIPQIVWQVAKHLTTASNVGGNGSIDTIFNNPAGGAGNNFGQSKVGHAINVSGVPCPLATLQNILSDLSFLGPNDELIIGEAYYRYDPLFSSSLGLGTSYTLYRFNFYAPRGPSLKNVGFSSGCVVL